MPETDASIVFRVDGFTRRMIATKTSTEGTLQAAELHGEEARRVRIMNIYGFDTKGIGGTVISEDECYVTLPLERFFALTESLDRARTRGRKLVVSVWAANHKITEVKYDAEAEATKNG